MGRAVFCFAVVLGGTATTFSLGSIEKRTAQGCRAVLLVYSLFFVESIDLVHTAYMALAF